MRDYLLVRFGSPKAYGSFNRKYEYPDVDFCLFKHFPHTRLVFPALIFNSRVNCTCTMSFLVKENRIAHELGLFDETNLTFYDNADSYSFNYLSLDTYNSTHIYCHSRMYNTTARACDFAAMLHKCNISEYNSSAKTDSPLRFKSDTDIFYMMLWLQFVLLILLKPLVCILALVSNGLTIAVLTNRSLKSEFNDQMYRHILLNAVFNLVYSGIMALKLAVNECLYYQASVFCSSLYQTNASQYFKIVVVDFLGNTFKTGSNLSYISFAFTRIALVRQQSVHRSVSRQKFSATYFVVFVCVGALLSGYKLFQYKLNWQHKPQKAFPYEIYDEVACSTRNLRVPCTLFTAFKFADNAVNDVLFFVLNVVLDVYLFVLFEREIKSKKKLLSMRLDELDKKQEDLTKMLLVSGALFFVAHFPELMSTVMLVVYARQLANFCMYKYSCDLLNEDAQFFCLVSMALQFFVYIRFNAKIRHSFFEIKARACGVSLFKAIFNSKG